MNKVEKQQLVDKIADLEKRIRELEARPPVVINVPQPYVPPPIYPVNPFIPYSPTTAPWPNWNTISCSEGTINTITRDNATIS